MSRPAQRKNHLLGAACLGTMLVSLISIDGTRAMPLPALQEGAETGSSESHDPLDVISKHVVGEAITQHLAAIKHSASVGRQQAEYNPEMSLSVEGKLHLSDGSIARIADKSTVGLDVFTLIREVPTTTPISEWLHLGTNTVWTLHSEGRYLTRKGNGKDNRQHAKKTAPEGGIGGRQAAQGLSMIHLSVNGGNLVRAREHGLVEIESPHGARSPTMLIKAKADLSIEMIGPPTRTSTKPRRIKSKLNFSRRR